MSGLQTAAFIRSSTTLPQLFYLHTERKSHETQGISQSKRSIRLAGRSHLITSALSISNSPSRIWLVSAGLPIFPIPVVPGDHTS